MLLKTLSVNIMKIQLLVLLAFISISCSINALNAQDKKEGAKVSIEDQIKQSSTDVSSMDNDEIIDEEDSEIVSEVDDAKIEETFKEHKSCKGCIDGSASFDAELRVKKHVYFLYGAEHLKLKNYYFDIPVVYNDQVKKWIEYFLNKGKPYFIRYSERAGRYAPVLGKILADYGLPRDLIFLAMAESGFQNNAKSWAKAVGPWQFMPYTGAKFGLKIDWYVDERRDPIKATIAASRYLKELKNRFGAWELAAAAYNAGEGKVGRAVRRYKTENFWQIQQGRYLKSETRNYVPKIMALAIIGKNLESFGFKDIDFHEPLDFEEITIPNNTDLVDLAFALDVEFSEIQRLNPELLRWQTPPNVEEYHLRLPVGKRKAWELVSKDKDFSAVKYQTYIVKSSRSTLADVAKKLKIKKPAVLSWINGNMSVIKHLPRGTEIKTPFRVEQDRKAAMYADLYELPRKSVRIRRTYKGILQKAVKLGSLITNPSVYYTVGKGDSLWTVAKKTGVPLYTLIRSNLVLIQQRMIRAGDRLAIR